jgi:hypothetical protein
MRVDGAYHLQPLRIALIKGQSLPRHVNALRAYVPLCRVIAALLNGLATLAATLQFD